MVKTPPISDAIEQLGVGKFTYKLLLSMSFVPFVDGIELTLIATLAPYLACQWNLTKFEMSIISSSSFIGLALGSITLGWIGDRIGRRPVLIFSQFLSVYFSFLCISADGFEWVTLIRMMVGFGASSMILPAFFISEFTPIHFRGKFTMACCLTFTFGTIYVAIVAYFTLTGDDISTGSKLFLAISSIPSLISFALSLNVPESIRYFAAVGNASGVRNMLDTISKLHKRSYTISINSIMKHQKSQAKSVSTLSAFVTPWKRIFITLARALLFSSALWNFYSFVFWNIVLLQEMTTAKGDGNVSTTAIINNDTTEIGKRPQCQTLLKKSDYLQNILVTSFDVVGTLTAFLLIEKVGRKKLIILLFPIMGLLQLLINLKLSKLTLTILMGAGRCVCGCALPTVGFYITELFPTTLRGKGVGICYAIAYIGTPFVPILIQDVSVTYKTAVTVGYAVLCVVSSLVCMTQRVTTGKPIDGKGEF